MKFKFLPHINGNLAVTREKTRGRKTFLEWRYRKWVFLRKNPLYFSFFVFFVFFVFRRKSPLGKFLLHASAAHCNLYFGFRADSQNPRFRFLVFRVFIRKPNTKMDLKQHIARLAGSTREAFGYASSLHY